MGQLKQGIRIESEHLDLFNKIRNCGCPCNISKTEFFGDIARAHLKEDPNYYSKLKKARL